MEQRVEPVRKMSTAEMVVDLLIILEVILIGAGLIFGTDMADGGGRIRAGDVFAALQGDRPIESKAWLLIARISVAALIITGIYYFLKIRPNRSR